MEASQFTHDGRQGYATETRESHWQPALRPDATEPADDRVPTEREEVNSHASHTGTTETPLQNAQLSSTSQELPSDDDEERLDPAWSITKADTARVLESVHRTSSFPHLTAISPAAAQRVPTVPVQEISIPASQVQQLLQESKEDELRAVGVAAGVDASEVEILQERSDKDMATSGEGETIRYQEGLPLIDSHQQPTRLDSLDTFAQGPAIVGGTDAEEDDGVSFFANATLSTSEPRPTAMDRKSTSDVLHDLQLSTDRSSEFVERIEESEVPESDFFSQEPSADDLFGAAPTDEVTEFESTLNATSVERPQPDPFAEEPSAEDLFSGESATVESTDAKWAAILDDDEFLIDDDDDLLSDSEPGSPSSFIASLNNDPIPVNADATASLNARPTVNPYAPQQAITTNATQLSPKAHGNVGFSRPGLAPIGSFQSQLQNPTIPTRTESYVDQSKGGYKSPYDLPMDLRPKTKPQSQRVASMPQRNTPLPPPRSSSISSSDKSLQPPIAPNSQQFGANTPNITSMPNPGARAVSTSAAQIPRQKRDSGSSGFFEELPVVSRPRPAASAARYAPGQPSAGAQPIPNLQSPPQHVGAVPARPSPQVPSSTDPLAQFQLRPPEKIDPYANVVLQPSMAPPVVPTTRYSPAPPAQLTASRPSTSPRYSPAPPSQAPATSGRYTLQPAPPLVPAQVQGPPAAMRNVSAPVLAPSLSNHALQFQPRTSSPLAYQRPGADVQSSQFAHSAALRTADSPSEMFAALSPPIQRGPPRSAGLESIPAFSPPGVTEQPTSFPTMPLKRSQTQSPSRHMRPQPVFALSQENGLERPASAFNQPSFNSMPRLETQTRLQMPAATPVLEFITPNDDTRHDPLERWKGAPIFRFGFGGSLVSSFPKHTPRYSSGLARPQIKPAAGEVLVRKAKDVVPPSESVASFPGPLRGKSKKKDVVNWLNASITRLEAESPSFLGLPQVLPDPRTCHDEKIILWKIMKILVEYDGALEANPEALKALNVILAPEIYAIDDSTASQYNNESEPAGIYRPAGAVARAETTDPAAVEGLRKHLMKGNRNDAVWHAVDNRLWSHALLISSTLDSSVWKQVVQEFVRQEVKTIGDNAESLSTIYEIFGGNVVDSVDQLVPPSARAGLQMVSRVETAGPTKNALDGLSRWRETLTLVLNNRSKDAQQALMALAKLLGDYGRIEAAHICLLFCRGPMFPNLFGGLDDSQAIITLLGADQRTGLIQRDEDAILLTEVYEFATCTLGAAATAIPMPYLASYKLERAKQMSDHGMKNEAQAYCEAITASIGTKTKVSPYYHPVLLGDLEDLLNRLKQIPVQSTSWIAKPTIEKVSGSIFSKFTNFVAGDDSDAESKGSAKDANADVGPFAKVTGSPSLSRSGSQTDLYGSFPTMTSTVPNTMAGSRYAPNGMVSARSSSEATRGRPSIDSQRSPPTSSYGIESRQSLFAPMTQNHSPARNISAYQPGAASPGNQYGTSPANQFGTSPARSSNYQATPPQNSYMPMMSPYQPLEGIGDSAPSSYLDAAPLQSQQPYLPTPIEEQPMYGGYAPVLQPATEPEDTQDPTESTSAYEPVQSYGYEPPADGGYVPYEPEPDSDDEATKSKPKKKTMVDNDNDEYRPMAAASQSSTRPASQGGDDAAARRKAADDATNSAFLAAAAEDERRAKEQAAAKKSGGWFGGWLGGGKKEPNALDGSTGSSSGSKSASGAEAKVHRAKLGETKMKLYYDNDLKKWVNPDDPNSGKPSATPPPPPSRGAAGTPAPPTTGGPPPIKTSALPPTTALSRSSTPASVSSSMMPPPPLPSSQPSPAPPGSAGAAGPPKKPATSAAAAGSIDDLLGPATGGARSKGAKGAKKKAGRYVDVMAQS